jgi:hypothetical protein
MTAIVRRDGNGRWLPGTTGNPEGRRAETSELKLVRELARDHTATAIETLVEIAADTQANTMARVRACEALLSRGWGQPSPEVDLDLADGLGDATPAVFVFRLGEQPLEIEGDVDEAEWDDSAADAAP